MTTCNVWIRMHEPGHNSYTSYKEHYIPKETELQTFCYCGFPLGEAGLHSCTICSSDIYKAVNETAIAGALTKEICNIFKL